MQKPANYYSMLRSDVLPLIPAAARRILSLGCGEAATEYKFRNSHDCHITGLEINAKAAALANDRIDVVHVGNLSKTLSLVEDQSFDVILALDIFEHIPDPWTILKRCSKLLSPDGVVIASIPNINHESIRTRLQVDIFPYEPAGILDFTHLRFFTLTEIYKLFVSASLKIVETNSFKSRTDSIQYIVKAKHPAAQPSTPLSTIIIPTLNNLALTKNCLRSIRENTKATYRIIVVDNGSTDGTRNWLKSQHDILHILNISNLGFGPAVNQGIFCADTPSVVILNNDTMVSPNWLTNMLAHFNADPTRGIVGPMSNFVSGPQLIADTNLGSLESVNQFSANLFDTQHGNAQDIQRLVFFCALIKKDVIDKIGGLDERFILGNFEDDDFCRRASLAGFKCAMALDTFIYHHGHATFKANKIDLNFLLEKNKQIYLNKWGGPH